MSHHDRVPHPHALPGERLRRVGQIVTLVAVAFLVLAGLAVGYSSFQTDDQRVNQLVNEKGAPVSNGQAHLSAGGRQVILAGDRGATCAVRASSGQTVQVGPNDSRIKGDGGARFAVGTFDAPAGAYGVRCTPDKDVVVLPESAVSDIKTAGTLAGVSVAGIPVFLVLALVGVVLWTSGSRRRARAVAMNRQATLR